MPLSDALLIVALLLVIATAVGGLCRSLPVPYTVVLVLVGMALGEAGRDIPGLAPILAFRLHPELVFFVFLPALIFESGFNLDVRRLSRDLVPVLVLAVPALLVSTAIVATGVWSLLGTPLLIAALFGALISATDPVAVVALFKELGAPARLTILIEGESLLNDATAIVAFTIILGLITGGAALDAASAAGAALRFLIVFLGGATVGVVCGLVLGELLRWLRTGTSSVLVISIVMAYLSFILAEHYLHVSGVMASAAAALTFGMWGVTRIPPEDSPAIRETWELIAHVCNSLLFLLVGLSIEPAALADRSGAVIVTVLLVLLARAATVYTLVPVATQVYSLPTVSAAERHVMWWGGLKGGLAVAMALAIPETVPGRQLVLDLTVGVVLFMLLVNAPTIRPLMRHLKLDRMTGEERAELAEGMRMASAAGSRWLERLKDAGAISAMHRQHAASALNALIETEAPEVGAGMLARYVKLDAIRAEMETLEALHAIGLIPQYTFLEMRNLLLRDRERGVRESAAVNGVDAGADNPFVRAEMALLRALRERDWAGPLLARYQGMRLAGRLRRTVAGIIVTEAALDAIGRHAAIEYPVRDAVAQIYRPWLQRRRERLDNLRRDFPDTCRAISAGLARRTALAAARIETEHAHHRGTLGAKAYRTLHARLAAALEATPALPRIPDAPGARELIALVPFFSGLEADALDAITKHAVSVNFLPADIVIGEGEHGDALYLVARGSLAVYRKTDAGDNRRIGTLSEGQFFGETALLGDHVRTATVIAETACTLVRLAHEDVLRVADADPRVRARLEAARAAHENPSSDATSQKT